MKVKNLILILLLIPVVGFFCIKNKKKDVVTKNNILSAWVEGVISGADITFYDDNSMEYCSMSLTGKKCYYGKYELIKDTFFVRYSNRIPSIKSTKMIKSNNNFLFLNEENKIVYKFYLDNQFRETIN
jgi:hypothetical protein